jgi:hypothetical protein
MNMLFFRLLSHEDKATALSEAVAAVGEGHSINPVVHAVDPASFRQVPGSPFAYWVSERIRRLFTELAPFEGEGRTVKQGLATADDFRFVRAWWEVPPERILDGANGPDWQEDLPAFQVWCRQRTFAGKRWVPFAKGGEYSPYYADLHLVVNWERDGEELRNFERAFIRNENFYFHPGLTWPLRTNGLSFRAVPLGSVFGHKGPMAFESHNSQEILLTLAAVMNSHSFYMFVQALVARVSLAQSFEVGLIQSIPVFELSKAGGEQLGKLTQSAIVLKQSLEAANETNHVFVLPALLRVPGNTLAERTANWVKHTAAAKATLVNLQPQIDKIAAQLYGIAEADQQLVQVSPDAGITDLDGEEDDEETHAEETAAAVDNCHLLTALLSYALGTALGRWDIRYAMSQHICSEPSDPFAPLPVYSPGMLTGANGLPLHEVLSDYPLRIDQDGILVDDSDHQDDIIRRIRVVLELIWENRADAIEQEACNILGVKELRDYFRKPGKGGFWDDHVKRYSKSRRKAPIYWLLQSSKKNYALWLYYHRLDKDMLFKVLVNYVEPKIRLEEGRLEPLRAQRTAAGASGKGVKKLEKDIDRQEEFISELRDFEGKLRRVANLHLDPDLNDGVVLNIAPLRELVPWKEAQKYWDELLDGKYEWSSIGRQLRQLSLVRSP